MFYHKYIRLGKIPKKQGKWENIEKNRCQLKLTSILIKKFNLESKKSCSEFASREWNAKSINKINKNEVIIQFHKWRMNFH